MWKRRIQYFPDDKNLSEHLTVAKFPLSNKDKDGKPNDIANVQYQESLRAYEHWSKN